MTVDPTAATSAAKHRDEIDIRGGVHYCLGANLARLELAEALKVLARWMPNARSVGPAPWKPMLWLERADESAH